MAAIKNVPKDVSAASVEFHEQNFASATEKNAVPKFPHKHGWTLHKPCKYKGFF